MFIQDLLDTDSTFITLENLRLKYNFNANFFEYLGLINAVKKARSKNEFYGNDRTDSAELRSTTFKHIFGRIIDIRTAKSKDYYDILIEWNSELPIAMSRWEPIGIEMTFL